MEHLGFTTLATTATTAAAGGTGTTGTLRPLDQFVPSSHRYDQQRDDDNMERNRNERTAAPIFSRFREAKVRQRGTLPHLPGWTIGAANGSEVASHHAESYTADAPERVRPP